MISYAIIGAGWAYTPENSNEKQIIIFPKYKKLLKNNTNKFFE